MALTHKTFIFLNLTLLAVIVYLGVTIFYKVSTVQLEYGPLPERTGETRAARAAAAQRPLTHYAAIKNRDLFKTGTAAAGRASVDIAALKVTGLELRLWGTVADEHGQRTYAVIEDLKTRQQGLYHPGDKIQEASVRMVLREKVILSVNGRDEVLEMTSPVANETPGTGQTQKAAAGRKIALRRAFIVDAAKDIGGLLKQASIVPHLENGQPAGLLLTSIKPGSVFRRLGLRNGDILTGVAGKPVAKITDATALYQELTSADNVVVQIKRRNRLQMLTYDIQ